MQITRRDFSERFFSEVQQAQEKIILCTPFVQKKIMDEVNRQMDKSVGIDLVTNFNFSNFYRGASDTEAITTIMLKNGNVFNHQLLNGNVYIFDDKRVIVTSNSLTYASFYKKTECGVWFDDELQVESAVKDMWNLINGDETSRVNQEQMEQLNDILKKLWAQRGEPAEEIDLMEIIPRLYEGDLNQVKMYLTDWQKTILNLIEKHKKRTFTVKDILANEKLIQSLFPKNYTIATTAKRTLKELRNLGLIQYIGQDKYQILWW